MSNGGGSKVVIPAKVKKVIQNIKEISGNHDDEDVYFMLKECNMDPNETAQRLLQQDSFQEVRRKRDRRKEYVKESAGSRWKPGMQDQGNRGERGNYSSRHMSHDTGGAGQKSVSIKENGITQVLTDRAAISPLSNSQDVKSKEVSHPSSTVNLNTHAGVTSDSKSVGHAGQPVAAASDVTKVDSPLISESTADENNANTKCCSKVGSSSIVHEKSPNLFPLVHKDQLSESSKAVASTPSHPTGSIPFSDYSVRSPEVISPPKVAPNKEWKPKFANSNLPEGPRTTLMLEVPATPDEARNEFAKQTTFGLEKKLEETCISDSRQVIIPKHIQVPEVEKLGFIFGSFDANFGSSIACPDNEKSPSIPETSEGMEENADQTRVVPEYSESKQETDLPPGYQQYSTVHAYPNYGFGIMPSMAASQVLPTESTKSQTHDISRLPAFVVQQPFDLAGYYAQYYRPGVDIEGRPSLLYEPAISTKDDENVTMLPPENSQSSQEGGDTLILPTSDSTPPATQSTGVVPSSVAVTQQTIPVFGQPAGMHLPHYPNYIPYGGHYYFPFYLPPPAMHQYMSNGAFPPSQPQAGSVYPAPGSTNKYSLPQYKAGSTTGNTNNVAAHGSYGPYGNTPASFSPSSATGQSRSGEDLLTVQIKDNNLFIAGQQSEGTGVWLAPPGRDISGLQASSFYNIPQAQIASPATPVSHGNYAGNFYSAQPVTGAAVHPLLQQSQVMAAPVDVNGPAPSVYQPSQPAPINWPRNY
ncbi:GBF-interacting protein 1-like isoform X2 [Apium graveolens]|uniref:GBF-interacting protein 1-like isoform X2 n=1 Tax=Apium graveolens TaxID=4045 RepID=UPI003D7AF8A0